MMPSPHIDVQPEVPEQSGSFWQSIEHPSNDRALPSSQPSAPSTFLSPQTVDVHWAPSHFQPSSSLQVAEQPSPLSLLPSSQVSAPDLMPSPHFGVQALPATRHWNPGSTILQSPAQPSPPVVFLSSHFSLPSRIPLPHSTFGHWQSCPGVHTQPIPLIVQSAEQPSPST